MTAYANGARLERDIAAHLHSEGYETARTAGSHGVVDVYAFKYGQTLAIQCKLDGKLSTAEWNALYEYATKLGHVPILGGRGKLVTRRVGLVLLELLGPRVPRSRDFAWRVFVTDSVGAA